MKVLDLQCRHGHVFEGWFASEEDFQGQRERGLVQCPLCADDHIEKRLSAPRLNLGARAPAAEPASTAQPRATEIVPASRDGGGSGSADTGMDAPAQQAAWLNVARKLLAHTEDVGSRFAQEARRMHYGEAPERAIRGRATPHEAGELLEEGIAVVPLPLPVAAKETLQ